MSEGEQMLEGNSDSNLSALIEKALSPMWKE